MPDDFSPHQDYRHLVARWLSNTNSRKVKLRYPLSKVRAQSINILDTLMLTLVRILQISTCPVPHQWRKVLLRVTELIKPFTGLQLQYHPRRSSCRAATRQEVELPSFCAKTTIKSTELLPKLDSSSLCSLKSIRDNRRPSNTHKSLSSSKCIMSP